MTKKESLKEAKEAFAYTPGLKIKKILIQGNVVTDIIGKVARAT